MKKGFIITAFILVISGVAVFAGSFIASGYNISKLDTAKYKMNQYFVYENFTKIEIDTKETDIILKPSSDGKASAVCFERESTKHSVSVENGVLKIEVDDNRNWYEHFTPFSKTLTLTLNLPSDYYESLKISNSTGDVSIPSPFSFGDIEIKLSTGDVTCKASADKHLKIKSSTGDILLDGVKAKIIDVSASTGDVRLNNSDAAEIKIKTSTGDVSGTLLSEKVFITKTSTGSVNVPKTKEGGKCEISTSTGDINIKIANSKG